MKTKVLIIYCILIIGVIITQSRVVLADEPAGNWYWQYYSPCECDDGSPGHWYKCEKDGNTLEECTLHNEIKDCQNNQTGKFCEDSPIPLY